MKKPLSGKGRSKLARREWDLMLLRAWNLSRGVVAEHRFAAPRLWRFDWAWPEFKVALEVEGGRWQRKGHTAPVRFGQDMAKYNTAALLGWTLIRCDPSDFRKGRFAPAVTAALASKGWRG